MTPEILFCEEILGDGTVVSWQFENGVAHGGYWEEREDGPDVSGEFTRGVRTGTWTSREPSEPEISNHIYYENGVETGRERVNYEREREALRRRVYGEEDPR